MVDRIEETFDELAVNLSNGGSRRLILRRLMIGALGALGMLNLTEDEADAAPKKRRGKKRRRKKCPRGRRRCGRRCCRRGQVCRNGKCRRRPQPGKPGCTPDCTGKTCGPDGCGGSCGTCPDGECRNGQCIGACGDCADGCCDGDTCRTGATRLACGHSGGVCQTCNPEVECVSGECTCTRTSCATGCCTIVDGKPFCDNTQRPCGDTCIDYGECCHSPDNSIYSATTPGCWGPEICSGVNRQGAGQCLCGGNVCESWGPNAGCCTIENGQHVCNRNMRRCGDTCIPKTECCQPGGEPGCDTDNPCAPATCEPATGTGQTIPPGTCKPGPVSGICPETCDAGYGYGNDFPEYQREVVCGKASSGTNCYCWRTVEGENVCTEDTSDHKPCRTSVDCAGNEACIRSTYPIVGGGSHYICARVCA